MNGQTEATTVYEKEATMIRIKLFVYTEKGVFSIDLVRLKIKIFSCVVASIMGV